jgi:DNA-binding NarL/FixJ family response regulator
VVRMGISSFLARHPEFELLEEAKDGLEALKRAKELRPDIVLMDIDMPHLDGLALTEILRKELPQTKVIFLSGLSTTRFIHRILQSGARGFISKQASSEELLTALEVVAAGDTFFSPEVARLALNQLVSTDAKAMGVPNLSDREREILMLIAEGLSNKEIAAHLDIGARTVETHRERIMRKLNVHSVAGLTTFAVANGLVQLPGATARGDHPGRAPSTPPKFEAPSALSHTLRG